MSTKEMIEEQAEEIGASVVDGSTGMRTQAKATEAALKMATFMLSPEFLRVWYAERIEELQVEQAKIPVWPTTFVERERFDAITGELQAYRTLLEAL